MTIIEMAADTARPEAERIALYEANNRLIRLEGEAKVYRDLLAKCADVIYTIEGEDSTESAMLSKLHQACEDAIKVVL